MDSISTYFAAILDKAFPKATTLRILTRWLACNTNYCENEILLEENELQEKFPFSKVIFFISIAPSLFKILIEGV